jgi:hypothetical protein
VRAFDCTTVTLPSSIVICGDPELMQLADERQEGQFPRQSGLASSVPPKPELPSFGDTV